MFSTAQLSPLNDLNKVDAMRGYMTSRYLPDCPRSSRYVLKDVKGRLLYCQPHPCLDAAHSQATPTLEEGGITHPGWQGSEGGQGGLKLKAKMSAHSKGTHGVSKYVCTERLQKVSAESSLNLLNI